MSRNMYDPPFIAMINSGTFWRCDHGYTRFSGSTCWRCAVRRPRRWWKYSLVARFRRWRQP